MSARRLLPVLAALLGVVAVFVLRARDEPGGAGGQEGPAGSVPDPRDVPHQEEAPQLQGAAPPRLTPSARAQPTDATPASGVGSEAPAAGGTPPAVPPSAIRGLIRGRANLPAEARPETWVVVWQTPRHLPWESVGAGRVLADGTFELDVPSLDATYALSLRPHDGLWPWHEWKEHLATTVRGDEQRVVLEPPELASFRLLVRATPALRTATQVQVINMEHRNVLPNLKLELAAGANEIEVTGAQEGVLYTVHVGPTSDRRYGFWQGRPKPNEQVEVTLERGGSIRGLVTAPPGLTTSEVAVVMRSLMNVEVLVPLEADWSFEQWGIQSQVLWHVEARAKDRAGNRLKSAAETVTVGGEVTLKLEPVRR